jgi:hypothetical protein
MKLSEFRSTYYEFSGKASDVSRSLAFAGIAVIWIYRVGGDSSRRPNPEMLLPTVLLVVGLALDLLQYTYSAAAWGVFTRMNEHALEDLTQDPDLDAPRWLNWPTLICFWGKLLLIATAYVLIAVRLGNQWLAALP